MMKLYIALGALATAVCVTPIAGAEPGDKNDARNYTIDVKGDVLPSQLGDLEYPYRAADRGVSGECQIKVEVAENGKTKAYDVTNCSNALFQRAAAAFAKSSKFDTPNSDAEHTLTVSWNTGN